jgi:CRISPR/Cas system-associated endonuclease/helicase Cas3
MATTNPYSPEYDDGSDYTLNTADNSGSTNALALTRAKKRARKKNKHEKVHSLKMPLDLSKFESDVYTLDQTFGALTGTIIVTSVKHTIGAGSITDIKIRHTLQGY